MKKYLIIFLLIMSINLSSGFSLDEGNVRTLTLSKEECKAGEELLITFTYDSTWKDENNVYFGEHRFYSVIDGEKNLILETDKINGNGELYTYYFVTKAPIKSGEHKIEITEEVHVKDNNRGIVKWLDEGGKSITLTVLENPDIHIVSNIGNVDLTNDKGENYNIDLSKSLFIKDVEYNKFIFVATKRGYQDNTFMIDTTDNKPESFYELIMVEETLNPSLTINSNTHGIKLYCKENGQTYDIDESITLTDLENWKKYNFVASKEGYNDYEFVGIPSDGGNTVTIKMQETPKFTIYVPQINSDINLICNNGQTYVIPANENSIDINNLKTGDEYEFKVFVDGYDMKNFKITMPNNSLTYNLIPINSLSDEQLKIYTTDVSEETNEIQLTIVDIENNEINDAIVYVNGIGSSTEQQPISYVVPTGEINIRITHPDMIDFESSYNIKNNTRITLTLMDGTDVSTIINADKNNEDIISSIPENVFKIIIGILIFGIVASLMIRRNKK